jgi:hypothetical protein
MSRRRSACVTEVVGYLDISKFRTGAFFYEVNVGVADICILYYALC